MIPGPDYIYKCPNCDNLFRGGSLTSGNTFGAKLFSDGVSVAPMLPNFPSLTKCGNCGSFLNFRELEEIGVAKFNYHSKTGYDSINWKGLSSKMKYMRLNREDIPHSLPLGTSDLYKALEKFPEHELSFRQQIWWSLNDRFRISAEHNFPISEAEFKIRTADTLFEENCYALLKLLDPSDENQKIMMAELYRNVGQFDKCMELIETLSDSFSRERIVGCDYKRGLKTFYKIECDKGNRFLFRIDNYAERMRKDFEEKMQKIEEERVQKELKDDRWKVCSNGHCYENIQTNCRWCGEYEVVSRLEKSTPIFHKVLYVGKVGKKYVLTENKNIKNQEEKIRKITVGYNSDYIFYFNLDGKNPHPFCRNTIKLNELSIAGRELTKMCEEIIKGKQKEMIIEQKE